MKIVKPGTNLIQAIEKCRAKLAVALRNSSKQDNRIPDLEARSKELLDEISNLEAFAVLDDRMAGRLVAAREQLERNTQTLENIPRADQAHIDSDLRNVMVEAVSAITEALAPSYEKFLDDCTRQIRIYHPAENWARAIARNFPASIELSRIAHPTRSWVPPFAFEGQQLLGLCDEIIHGELRWDYDPHLTAPKPASRSGEKKS